MKNMLLAATLFLAFITSSFAPPYQSFTDTDSAVATEGHSFISTL